MRIEFHVGPCLVEVFHCPSDFRLHIEGIPLAPGWYWGESDWVLDHTTTYGPHQTAGSAVGEAVKILGEYAETHPPAAVSRPVRVRSRFSDQMLALLGAIFCAFVLGIAAGAAITRAGTGGRATMPPATPQPAAAEAAYGATGTGAATGLPGAGVSPP